MFGDADATGRRPSLEAVAERVAWWSELFEIPCVGVALALDEVEVLARAGADFIALGAFVWNDPSAVAATVRAAGGLCIR
jgi:thiamine-phosphate pyrophosphorylase